MQINGGQWGQSRWRAKSQLTKDIAKQGNGTKLKRTDEGQASAFSPSIWREWDNEKVEGKG